MEEIFRKFSEVDMEEIRKYRQNSAKNRFSNTCSIATKFFKDIIPITYDRRPKSGNVHCPPILSVDMCPPISIITPTYNRGNLIKIAFHNLLSTDYPHDKIEWVVVEDNEKKDKMYSEDIINFQIQVPQIKIKYIPIEGRMTIGEKRNIGIENASNDIILFMDDDDHYPSTSFRRRVAWLTKGAKCGQVGKATIACCTTLALYDLKTGISAVNVPPFDIPLAQRISEATLTFYKSAWIDRPFSSVSIAEGEEWIKGREDQVIEIPPQQIIVAFSHGNNKSSRRIPPSENPPGCFWGFPKEYLIFIHKLAGVDIEDTGNKHKNKK
jgi:glycosyltransferase involved in cell wall biosynthesis